jgi:hypothetical protein
VYEAFRGKAQDLKENLIYDIVKSGFVRKISLNSALFKRKQKKKEGQATLPPISPPKERNIV